MAAGKRATVALDGVLIAEQISGGIELVLAFIAIPKWDP